MRTLDYLVLGGAVIFTLVYILPMFNTAMSYAAKPDPAFDTLRAPPVKGNTPSGGGADPWQCITHRERLQVLKDSVTITGTVLNAAGGFHLAPDGDGVFSVKLDPQFAGMTIEGNNDKHYGGGIWCEAVCQGPNKAKEPRHAGDCKCNAPKFKAPKIGQRVRVTGAYVRDVGETPQKTEIHPITALEIIG